MDYLAAKMYGACGARGITRKAIGIFCLLRNVREAFLVRRHRRQAAVTLAACTARVSRALRVGFAALVSVASLVGCEGKPPPAPARTGARTRIDETMHTLGAEGLRLERATVVVQLSPSGILRSRFYRRLAEALGGTRGGASPAPHEALREKYGIDLSAVEAVAFTMDPERNTFVLAAATRAPVEPETWLAALPRMRGGGVLERFDTYGGVELYAPPREYAGALAFPAGQVVAAGSTPELMRGIDAMKAGTPPPYPNSIARLLEAAPARAEAIVAFVPTRRLMEELTAAAGGPSFAQVAERAEGVLLAVTARETLEVEVRMFMRTDAAAAAAREEALAALEGLESTLGAAGVRAEVRPLVRLVDDVRVGGTGSVVEIGVTIPPGAIAPLVRRTTSGGD